MMNRPTAWRLKVLKRIGASAVISLAAFCLAEPASARTFFVASTAIASDENPGTREEPLRSIGVGIRLAAPGDLVFVQPGDYRNENTGFGVGTIPVLNSGTPSDPIRIRGHQNRRPIIRKFLVTGCHDVIIESFNIQGTDFSSLDGWEPMPTIVRAETASTERPDFSRPYETRQTQIETEFATYFSQVNRLGFDIGVDMELCQGVLVNDNDIAGYFAGVQCRGCEEIKIENNRIKECFNGIFVFNTDDPNQPGLVQSFIRNNDIQQCLDNGIDVRANAQLVRIEDNKISFSARSHISLRDGSERCRIQFNTLCFGGYYSETMVFPGSSGISLNDAGSGNVVLKNTVSNQVDLTGIDGNGIIVDFMREDADAAIRSNLSRNNMGAGMNLTVSPGTSVTGNVVRIQWGGCD